MKSVENQKKFLMWLKRSDPHAYKAAVNYARLQDQGAGLGSVMPAAPGTAVQAMQDATITQKLVSALESVLPSLATAYTTDRVLKAQLSLAKQGLPPLTTSQYAPTMQLSMALSEEGENSAKRIAEHAVGNIGIKQLWPFLAVGGVLLYLFITWRNK
jgi:hypothetical protein